MARPSWPLAQLTHEAFLEYRSEFPPATGEDRTRAEVPSLLFRKAQYFLAPI